MRQGNILGTFKPGFDYYSDVGWIITTFSSQSGGSEDISPTMSLVKDTLFKNSVIGLRISGISRLVLQETKPFRYSGALSHEDETMILPGWNYNSSLQHLTALWKKGPYDFRRLSSRVGIFRDASECLVGARLFGIESLVDERTIKGVEHYGG